MTVIEKMMKKAIVLAKKARSNTLPNPRVGAVIFDDGGNILGQGYHREFGHPHAEVEAVYDAMKNGSELDGASMCVTLEPCNHTGKTPPCTEVLKKSGISKIYIGTMDNNSKIICDGCSCLKDSGLEVYTGILKEECRDLNPGFHKYNEAGLPYVQLKIASSLNGKIGQGEWFTGEQSRLRVHELRANSDLIITGVGTVEKDNPCFNSRLNAGTFTNTVAVLDTRLRLMERYISGDLELIRCNNQVIVVTSETDPEKTALLTERGIRVVNSELPELIRILADDYGFREIFVEGGAGIMNTFLTTSRAYVDKLVLFIAPKWFNQDVEFLFKDAGENFPQIDFYNMELLGNTLCVEGRLHCLRV
ncbi:MAG: bifunctional diaminohydroxyphosphoribosylaminopyrimidine deaminase/5-amino-6-(5-phosphoribosylamino)uracil reductase RibD [Oligoflexia bacterium]|nr:bifunctional diaminohydroxyphosphoribosylaminopyrimidine deaminase/5-amino-6-(5-phosphoribosylamino)uracil reductase RibD [Oligoflexia bacterium]